MKFWDSSAVVPLLVREKWTREVTTALRDDPNVLVWWGTAVECASALSRLERMEALDTAEVTQAFERLNTLAGTWNEVEPVVLVREAAQRFLRVHDLRAADSLQLAAALIAAENRPASLEIVTLDARLAAAASREGFRVLGSRELSRRK
ncbi:MAG: type II toxin-antitoxin system VapC family toxin [Acidobacteriota bacterium]